MENKYLIANIKSSYIFKNIFNYISDEIFDEKLLLYSKLLQEKFNIKIIKLKERYLNKYNFKINKFLYQEPNNYEKDLLLKRYNDFIEKKNVDKNILENIIYYLYDNKQQENTNEIKEDEYIYIESPLFKILSKTKYFENNITIYISQIIVNEYMLKQYYLEKFNKLNELNVNYSSIYFDLDNIKHKLLKRF